MRGKARNKHNHIFLIQKKTYVGLNSTYIARELTIFCMRGFLNISYRSGEKLYWDATKKGFTDAAINEKFLTNKYHNGYSLPII